MVNVDPKVLKQLKNLSRLSASQLDKLARNLTVRAFKKDEIVFGQDEQARLVYLLISGVVRVSYNGYERQTIVSRLPWNPYQLGHQSRDARQHRRRLAPAGHGISERIRPREDYFEGRTTHHR